MIFHFISISCSLHFISRLINIYNKIIFDFSQSFLIKRRKHPTGMLLLIIKKVNQMIAAKSPQSAMNLSNLFSFLQVSVVSGTILDFGLQHISFEFMLNPKERREEIMSRLWQFINSLFSQTKRHINLQSSP